MSEYTKGPWRVGTHGDVIADYPVPGLRGSDDVEYYGGHLIAESITPSNARLIAAAPELLEAAKAAMVRGCFCHHSSMDDWHSDSCPIPALRAAIAKATGK